MSVTGSSSAARQCVALLPIAPAATSFRCSHGQGLEAVDPTAAQVGHHHVIEQAIDTTHLTFEGIDVSVFVLPELAPYTSDNALTVTGLLATKVHAILDRGTRRDFFDLYVLLQLGQLGLLECLNALSKVTALKSVPASCCARSRILMMQKRRHLCPVRERTTGAR
jgi:hypothetical protein